MPVSFAKIAKGRDYSRNDLAKLWGYASYHAIARGVVTPRDAGTIILFVTELKQESAVQFLDRLVGTQLHWEGPEDHFAESRMMAGTSDEIHLFYRKRHHTNFTYMGKVEVVDRRLHARRPSQFVFKLRQE